MRKTDFLREVRQRIENQPPGSLKKLFLDFARWVPREAYAEALLLFEKGDASVVVTSSDSDLVAAVRQLHDSVKSGEYVFSWEPEGGYYDDGYWSDEETLYDRDGFGQKATELLEASMQCVNEKRYAKALGAFDELFSISIPGGDYDDFDLMTLFENDLISLDEIEVLQCYAYSVLMVLINDARTQKLYEIIKLSTYQAKLRDITNVGTDEIPERAEFARQWIAFLMSQKDRWVVEPVLIDAVIFSGGTRALHSFAKEHGTVYQTAYAELIKIYATEKHFEKAAGAALEGLAKLSAINHNRVSIADLLLEIGKSLDENTLIETAIWEGFRSSVDLRHFISLYDLNDECLIAQAIQHMDDNYRKDFYDYNYIHFLNGDYDLVWANCKKDKKFLGWSSSEKGKMIPLFVALLAGGKSIPPVIKKLIKESFPHNNYFENFLRILHLSFRQLPEADFQKYYDWCAKETEGRVNAIVQGQHRGSYYKASALVVAMAEGIRSNGDSDGAIRFIKSYKEKYPRHTAFHGCLREDITLGKFGKLF